MHENLIILAGGASSRMKKQTFSKHLSEKEIMQANKRSKGLIGVGDNDRPLMDYLLYNAKRAGYKKIYIIISEQGELFKKLYGENERDNEFHGLNISFAIQYIPKNRTKPFGTADALYQATQQYPELNNQYYTVCNSDNLYSYEALYALRTNDNENAFISYSRNALEFPPEKIARFALVKLRDDNSLLDIIEKPNLEDVENYKDASGELRVSMNAFMFNGAMFNPYLKNCPVNAERGEKELPTALLNMLKGYPNAVFGIPFSEHVPDLTAKDDIVAVKEYLIKNYKEIDWS